MRQVIAIFLQVILAASAAAAPGEEKEMTGAEIVARHIEAVGGKTAITRLRSRVAVGTIKKFDEPETSVYIFSETPNRVSATYRFTRQDWRLAYDGTNVVFRPQLPADFGLVQDKHREMIQSGLMFNGISLYNLLVNGEIDGVKFHAKGKKKAQGRPAHVVEVSRNKALMGRLFFDTETFMWVRTEYGRAEIKRFGYESTLEIRPGQDERSSIEFAFQTSDFREVDGVKLPFKFEQTIFFPFIKSGLGSVMTGTINEYKHNLPISPKVFE